APDQGTPAVPVVHRRGAGVPGFLEAAGQVMGSLPHRAPDGYVVQASQIAYTGAIFTVRQDVVGFPDGGSATRDVVSHHGAVAIVPVDDDGNVVMIEQYRHPVGELLWEVPAGLLDVPGEQALHAARRELAEEVGL